MADGKTNPLYPAMTFLRGFLTGGEAFKGRSMVQQVGWQGYDKWLNTRSAAPADQPPGPTDQEVLAADLRLRRALNRKQGAGSTVVTGGLDDQGLRLTMPSLIGTGKGG